MVVKDLIELLEKIPADAIIYIEVSHGGANGVQLEPVAESCDDDTIIGYVLVDQPERVQ